MSAYLHIPTTKFESGQKVRVRTFTHRPEHWNGQGEMDKWMGKIVTVINDCVADDWYHIAEDGVWGWTHDDFELVTELDWDV